MLDIESIFTGFSVDDITKAKDFYGNLLGLTLEEGMGGVALQFPSSGTVWMYHKDDHQPAAYTMLNFVVSDITKAYEILTEKGIEFIRYPGSPQDPDGIMRGKKHNMGPDIAWFHDPAGNILAILEN